MTRGYNASLMNALRELETYLSQFINFETLPQKNMFWLDTME
jgi:hypothetical protein